jgi:hypothetical protein
VPGAGKTKAHDRGGARGDLTRVRCRRLGAVPSRRERLAPAADDGLVECVLVEALRHGRRSEELRRVGVVVGEQPFVGSFGDQEEDVELAVVRADGRRRRASASAVPTAGPSHDQTLRNQSCGSSQSRAVSGPRLVAVTRSRTSSTSALAYSISTSK